MLKSNSKKAIDNIRRYIMEVSEDIREEEENSLCFDYDISDFDGMADCILNDHFYIEYLKNNKEFALHRKTLQELFTDWAAGLPLNIFDYYYYYADAVEILGDILEETEEERNRFTEEQAAQKLTYLIFRELTKRAKIRF